MTQRLLLLLVGLFPVSEIVLALTRRSRARAARREDRGSMGLIWFAIASGLGLAIAAALWVPRARLPGSPIALRIAALVLLAGGLAVRWSAILTLGRLFTVDVAIHSDHRIVERGLYRFVRHPSYAGLLIAFAGLGVCLANWLSMLGLLAPIILAIVHRVAREEQALLDTLGQEYATYRARTKRFFPGLV